MQNLEIKCRYPNLRHAERLAAAELQAEFQGEVVQTDSYFEVPGGRLKLRQTVGTAEDEACAELIFYRRPDRSAARISDYHRLPLPDAFAALAFLRRALRLKVSVRKRRRIYIKENMRLHLDQVHGLGKFLEFELIVSPEYSRLRCRRQLEELMRRFDIVPETLLADSYSDLLLRRKMA
jgi:predicted adenylyl cyclase CyaB